MHNSDQFLPDLYDPSYPNGNFICQNPLESPLDDLAGYEPFSKKKGSKPHYYPNNTFYPATYPPTTTPIHDRQITRPLSQGFWSSHSFGDVLDSPAAPITITSTSQAPLSPPASESTWTCDLFPTDFEANDDDQGSYPDRKGHLLSPLNNFRLQNLPHNNSSSSSVTPQGLKQRFRETISNFSPPDIPFSPDSLSESPCLSFTDEPWMSPASVTDDDSLASSISSLSPNALDLDTFPGEIPVEDEDFYSSLVVSPRQQSLYLDEYTLHDSPPSSDEAHLDDDNLSPLSCSPPSPAPLHLISLSQLEHQPTEKVSTYNPPLPLNNHNSFFDYDSSTPVPSSPSLRRSATLPELEPTTDPFGLHKSIPVEPSCDIDMDMPRLYWRSLPGCETDDDLIPVELASKNYIPDPSATVPTTSSGTRSLLLWDHDQNDRSDILTSRSSSPEHFYLDPTILAEYGDEEMQRIYQLTQRTAKSEKWERERCRELSALLRLKLDERGILSGSDCSHHKSSSRFLSCCSDIPCSSSPSGDSPTVYLPQPSASSPFSSSTQNSMLIPASSSLNSSTSPMAHPERPKHKFRSIAQLVASMLFHRQSDALRRYPPRKAGSESALSHAPSHSYHWSHPSPMGSTGVLPTPRSRLSEVILPEELETDREEGHMKDGDEVKEDVNVDERPLCTDATDLDEPDRVSRENSSHIVTRSAPHTSTQYY